MTTKTFKFDVHAAIPAAWDLLWNIKLKERAQMEADAAKRGGDFGKYGRRYYTRTFYVCAEDVVAQVRSFAYETAHGKAWGSSGQFGSDYGIRLRGDAGGLVRDWLLRTKDGHNFGRGHISGMRFRPKGAPMGPSETDTIQKKVEPRRPKPIHFSRSTYGGTPLCTAVSNREKGKHFSFHRSDARTRNEWAEVNCKRCLNLKADPLAVPRLVSSV